MKLGTIVYENEIYNLDYMTSSEISDLLHFVKSSKNKDTIILRAKLKSVYTNKVSQEQINQKVNHQLNSMKASILNINAKFNEKSKNFDKVNQEMLEALKRFEDVLKQLTDCFDQKIQQLIYKKVELEAELLTLISQNPEEANGKKKQKKEENQEDDASKKIIKLRKEIRSIGKRQKNLEETKQEAIFSAMEVGDKSIAVNVKKRRKIKNIVKLLNYKFNTYQVILKNVIEPLNQRIDEFKVNELKKVDGKSKEFDFDKIAAQIEEIANKIMSAS